MWNRKLGRTADHRKAMLRNMATSLILNGKIETTEMKAKELRSVVDELITLAKRGDLHARRQAAAYIRNVVADEKTGETVLKKLFDEIEMCIRDRLVCGDGADGGHHVPVVGRRPDLNEGDWKWRFHHHLRGDRREHRCV